MRFRDSFRSASVFKCLFTYLLTDTRHDWRLPSSSARQQPVIIHRASTGLHWDRRIYTWYRRRIWKWHGKRPRLSPTDTKLYRRNETSQRGTSQPMPSSVHAWDSPTWDHPTLIKDSRTSATSTGTRLRTRPVNWPSEVAVHVNVRWFPTTVLLPTSMVADTDVSWARQLLTQRLPKGVSRPQLPRLLDCRVLV